MNLFLFNHINQNPTLAALLRWRETGDAADYYTAARGLIDYAGRRLTEGNLIREYLLRVMLEGTDLPDIAGLRDFLRQDVKAVYAAFFVPDWDGLCRAQGLPALSGVCARILDTGLRSYPSSLLSMMECQSNEALGGAILAHTESFGSGPAAAYAALRWNGEALTGIQRPDPIQFSALTGLAHQKEVLVENTGSFVAGRPANDVLLTGSSGTGKSSCVKACLNRFKNQGLRLVELDKTRLGDLGKVCGILKDRTLRYIIFIDDLSFEPGDDRYKLLKSALDGQAEARGENILIYATSNRRGLIKETWSEREGGDEVQRSEGRSERKSLSARFGINLSFLTPTQGEYLQIVENLLTDAGVPMTEALRSQALSWQINYNGFSGRSAKQFVASILSAQ